MRHEDFRIKYRIEPSKYFGPGYAHTSFISLCFGYMQERANNFSLLLAQKIPFEMRAIAMCGHDKSIFCIKSVPSKLAMWIIFGTKMQDFYERLI